AWSDELHVEASREIYKKNFEIAKEILGVETPKSTFYIWLEIENALEFTQFLYKNYNLKVLPGEYLGRADKHGQNPGVGHIRLALVYDETKTKDALLRVKKALGEFSEKSN
ncbi:MAG: hypothetical protein U9N42_06290, partial [Campylobacterota bacterium]|nr:hypothetical protein [Campylobacterota bacterium]